MYLILTPDPNRRTCLSPSNTRLTKNERRDSDWGEADMIQRRIRVVKWLSTTPALGVCNLCSREFKVPMKALKRSADAQASLQEQFDRHKCQSLDSSEVKARPN